MTPKQAANTLGPASRYLAALTPVKKDSGGTVSLGSGPSVRQTQRLLLMKTGGLLAGTDGRFKYLNYTEQKQKFLKVRCFHYIIKYTAHG